MLIGNGTVCTFGAEPQLIEDGAVYVEGNLIQDVGKMAALEQRYPWEVRIDARGGLILPGLINAHTHMYSAFARGIPLTKPLKDFDDILQKLWWRLDMALTAEDIYLSALLSSLDCIKNGVTTVIDHHSSPNLVTSSLDVLAQACREMGVRACLCYEVSDRNGIENANEGIKENERWLKRCDHELLSGAMGMHASFTLSEDTLENCVEAADRYNAGFHIHVAEAKSDLDNTKKIHRKSVVERLENAGILGERTIAAHCVWLEENDIGLLRKSGTKVVHNPSSNMNNAVGTAPVPAMLDAEVEVGLGTDGFTQNMLNELRNCALVHKLVHGDPRLIQAPTALELLYQHNGNIASLYFDRPVGALVKGAYADLIIMDYRPPTPLTLTNLPWHLQFGITVASITTTIVNGVMLMQERRLNVDEHGIIAKARELADKLWQRW